MAISYHSLSNYFNLNRQEDTSDYYSFCGAVPEKMKDHAKAHSLRFQNEFVEAIKYS